MAIKRTRKSTASPKRKAMPQRPASKRQASGAAQLKELIQDLINAKQRGNNTDRDKAADEIVKFSKRAESAQLQHAAAEVQAVAGNQVMVESVRLLEELAARLNAAA